MQIIKNKYVNGITVSNPFEITQRFNGFLVDIYPTLHNKLEPLK